MTMGGFNPTGFLLKKIELAVRHETSLTKFKISELFLINDECFGDNKLRAGNRCYVKLKTEEETIDSMMLIEKAKHQYYKDTEQLY